MYIDTACGNGGVRATPRGGDGYSIATDSVGTNRSGNSGGGGVGFVVLKSADGTVDFASVAVISPEPSVGVLTPAP